MIETKNLNISFYKFKLIYLFNAKLRTRKRKMHLNLSKHKPHKTQNFARRNFSLSILNNPICAFHINTHNGQGCTRFKKQD